MLDRVVEATSPTVIKRYEQHIETLERNKALLEEQAGKRSAHSGKFDELFELAFRFLSRPALLWNSNHFAHKRSVLQLAFTDRLAFCPNEGFRRATNVMAE